MAASHDKPVKDGELIHLEEEEGGGEDEQVHLLSPAPALPSPSHRLHMDAKVRWHFGAKRSARSQLRSASRPQVGQKYVVSPQKLFLACFRCFLKDVPVLVSSPLNSIPDFVIPSHVVVPRCQGLCLGSLGAFFLFFCLL